jgi:hypothetical protein
MDDPQDEPPRRTGSEPYRGTVYGVRFGTPGNLPGPLPQPKDNRWVLIASISAAVVLLVGLTVAALVLA